jgi:hypothetical protein
MKYFLFIFFSLMVLCHHEMNGQSSDSSFKIWWPRKATPGFSEPGSQMTVEILASKSFTTTGWKISLYTDLGKNWDCDFLSAKYVVNGLDLGVKSGWKISFKIPEFAVPELCSLKITSPDGLNVIEPDAVSLIPIGNLNNDFYGVLFTDEHVYRDGAIKEDGANSMDNIKLSAQVLNIANPRFVASPGDYSTAQSKREEEWIEGKYLQVKSLFKVPTLQSTGNHEYDHWQNVPKTIPLDFTYSDYERYFGQRSYITQIGPVSILMNEINTNQEPVKADSALMTRVVNNWGTVLADTSVRYRIIIQHCFDPVMGAFIPERHGFGPDGCNLMIGGHLHKTAIASSPAEDHHYYRLLGTAAQRNGSCEWFNLNKSDGNLWSCPQASPLYSDSLNTVQLYSSATEKRLNLTAVFEHPNDGNSTSKSNKCTIVNRIRFNFYDGRIRFLMPRGKYKVSGGTLLGQYDYDADGKTRTAVVCRINIPPRSESDGTVTISVSKKGLARIN